MMHIFLTNDDGVEAPGIRAMALALSSMARVTVLAPHHGRSSCSSSLTLHQYLRVWEKPSYGEGIRVFACNGTTADCCKVALEYWLRDDRPDLLVSGINNGYNTGSDCLYSGTVAGAMEDLFRDSLHGRISGDRKKTGIPRRRRGLCRAYHPPVFCRAPLQGHPESQYSRRGGHELGRHQGDEARLPAL